MVKSKQQTKNLYDSKISSKRSISGQNSLGRSSTHEKATKPRHRASVACAACRDRRIRCVVPPGDKECTPCKRLGVECVIKNDDERRRPISKAYVCSLTERVKLLEAILRDRGEEPPPAIYPPKTRHGTQQDKEGSPVSKGTILHDTQYDYSSPEIQSSPQNDQLNNTGFNQSDGNEDLYGDANGTGPPSILPPPKKNGMVKRLLSTRGHLSFDQLSGRLRYFGPTTNCHVHSEPGNSMNAAYEQSKQARRVDEIICSLPFETYEYLMELFWQCYNPVIHVLHREAFNEDRDMGRTQFYSGFLHICVLAMGFRFADKSRSDIRGLAFAQMESTLHRQAKSMLDDELERPGGIPLVVALLLLSDLETGVGRDTLGWLYGGMAVRLAFDVGLHLDTRISGLSAREVEIRRMTLWACVIYDKYWAIFLGRPTSMKSSDLEIDHLSKQFERLGACRPAGQDKSMETRIYEALIDLMELSGKIIENTDSHSKNIGSSIDLLQRKRMATLNREFSIWYERLPGELKWTPDNIVTAPFSFFLLHQQYHACIILLHRPFALYEDESVNEDQSNKPEDHFSTLSRTVCTRHAIRIARIYWEHRQRFDTKQIFISGLQHAGTAATALVAALAFIKDMNERNNNMQYLECLSAVLSDMAYTYQPAERMSLVLRAVMVELRGGSDASESRLYKPETTSVPARHGSTNDTDGCEEMSHVWKKRQINGPRAGTGSIGKTSTSSMSTRLNTPVENHGFDVNVPPPPCYSNAATMDGYSMVTPDPEASASWPVLNDPFELSHGLSIPGNTLSPLNTAHNETWMNTEFDTNDSINPLANMRFPEMESFHDETGGVGSMTSLGMINVGEGGDWDVGKEWTSGIGMGSDCYGFPLQGGFGSNAVLEDCDKY